MTQSILHVDDVEGPMVSLSVGDDPHPPQVPPTCHHAEVAHVKFDEFRYFPTGYVNSDGVVDLYQGVRVADGATIVSDAERNPFWTELDSLHLAQLVLGEKESRGEEEGKEERLRSVTIKVAYLGFFWHDAMDGESPLHIIEQSEILPRLVNSDDICSDRGTNSI